jgi:hypothetical protein
MPLARMALFQGSARSNLQQQRGRGGGTVTAYERVRDGLEADGRAVKEKSAGTLIAQCPAHPDSKPSLSVGPRRDGKGVVVHCHAGCTPQEVVAAVDLAMRDLFDDDGLRQVFNPRRDYPYPDGRVTHRRPGQEKGKKKFWQTNPGGSALFGSDRLGDALRVYVTEGEKDAEAIEAIGGTAVSKAEGVGGAAAFDWTPLHGRDVTIVAHADAPGRKHAAEVFAILDGRTTSLQIVEAKAGNDAADHIAAGYGLGDFVESTAPPPESETEPQSPEAVDLAALRASMVDGGAFLFDQQAVTVPLWGDGDDILWAEGESLMIAGPPGLGKTTLAQLTMLAQIGLGDGTVLGLPVALRDGPILYLAMDRPQQIRRSMLRMCKPEDREVLAERVVIWKGPPPADIAQNPELLTRLALAAGASTVYIDSVKDAALGLSEDAVGAGYNRARQHLLANGIELLELHHTIKKSANGGPPAALADIYGSAWITAGTGSVVLLKGEAGDAVVKFKHLRQPAGEVGPLTLLHDQDAGRMTVERGIDLVELITVRPGGLTAKRAAALMFDTDKPDKSQVEKARRKLDGLVKTGKLRREAGGKGGGEDRDEARWLPA